MTPAPARFGNGQGAAALRPSAAAVRPGPGATGRPCEARRPPCGGSRRPPPAALRRSMLTVARAALFCLAALATAPPSFAAAPVPGGTLVVGGGAEPRHLNPALQSGASTGVPGAQLFAGLVRIDDRFEPQPYLARRWTVSADGLRYTFHLAANARFHDGAPVTSRDVAFSLDTVKRHHPFGRAMFDAVAAVETPGPHTAIVRLTRPHPALLQALAAPLMPIVPEHVYGDGRDPRTHPMNATPVGSGPFRFAEWARGRHLILERNDDFFLDGRPYLDRIVFRIVRDPSVRLLALRKGEVDYFPFTPVRFRELAGLAADPDLVVTTRGYAALGPLNYVEFNLRARPFDDLRVRRAVAYAIDQDYMVETLHGGVPRPGTGPFHHASPFHADVPDPYPVDLARARALLDAAGYPPDADGVRLRVVLDYPPFQPDSLATGAAYLKAQLAKAGIAVTLRAPADLAGWARRIAAWDYRFTLNSSWNYPDPVIGVHRLYLCDNIRHVVWSNTQGYCNETVDALLREAAAAADPGRRRALYTAFRRIVTAELPLYFLNEEPFATVYRRTVMNPPETVWGPMQPMDEVWLDR